MSDHDFGHPAGDPLPDRLKQYLSEMARRELEALRSDLEVRLVALETALARPNQHDSIETLVFDLARAATVEAEAAASRAMLAAQIEAQERSGTADALRDLEAERDTVKALKTEVEQLRSRVDAERARLRAEHKEVSDALAAAQRDLAAVRQELTDAQQQAEARGKEVASARQLADTRARELMSARDAAGAAQAEAAARLKTLEAKVTSLEAKAADAERVRREAVSRADAAQVLARETAARASNAEAWGKDVENRLQATEARTARDETRVQEAETRAQEAETRVREADARIGEAEARIREAEARIREAEARADAAAQARDALAAEMEALTQTIARERESAGTRETAESAKAQQKAQETVQEYEQRLAVADERIRMLELQLFQRDRPEPGVSDEELADKLAASPAAPFKPTRAASRYSFGGGVNVEIDGRVGALIDLSTTGAQVLSPVPLDDGKEAELRLMSDEIPAVCRGRIVWTRLEPKSPRQPLRYRAGLLFTQVDVGAVEAFIIRYAAT